MSIHFVPQKKSDCFILVYVPKTSVVTSLWTFYWSVVKKLKIPIGCQLSLTFEEDICRRVLRLPYENTDFIQVVVGRGYTTRFTLSPNQKSRLGRPSEGQHNWHTEQHFRLFPNPDSYNSVRDRAWNPRGFQSEPANGSGVNRWIPDILIHWQFHPPPPPQSHYCSLGL